MCSLGVKFTQGMKDLKSVACSAWNDPNTQVIQE